MAIIVHGLPGLLGLRRLDRHFKKTQHGRNMDGQGENI